jgi:hypothetical protein
MPFTINYIMTINSIYQYHFFKIWGFHKPAVDLTQQLL